jgi:hypothetical protein
MTIFEMLLYRGLRNLARRLYEFERGVLDFNHGAARRLLVSLHGMEDVSRQIYEAEASIPNRRILILRPLNEIQARATAQQRASPVEISVIHDSSENYNTLLPIVLQVVTTPASRLELFVSMLDYAARFSRMNLLGRIQQDALASLHIDSNELLSILLRHGYFSSAAELFSYLEQVGQMNEDDLVDAVISLFEEYRRNQQIDSIRSFFSTAQDVMFPQGSSRRTHLHRSLIDETLMRNLARDPHPGLPRREDFSMALIDGLSNSFDRNRRDQAVSLANATGQRRAEGYLRMIAVEGLSDISFSPASKKPHWDFW